MIQAMALAMAVDIQRAKRAHSALALMVVRRSLPIPVTIREKPLRIQAARIIKCGKVLSLKIILVVFMDR